MPVGADVHPDGAGIYLDLNMLMLMWGNKHDEDTRNILAPYKIVRCVARRQPAAFMTCHEASLTLGSKLRNRSIYVIQINPDIG